MIDFLIRLWNEVWYFPFMVGFIFVCLGVIVGDFVSKSISSFMNQEKDDSKSKDNLEIAWNQKELKAEKEILFRAKRADNGEWIEGYFVKYQPVAGKNEWKIGIVPVYASNNYLITVKPETVCQYRGLQDKNRIKIFEGDICKNHILEDKAGMIVIKEDYAELKITSKKKIMIPLFYLKYSAEWEVIGNIFDNPELLEIR